MILRGRCPHCGSSNTRRRYRRHRHHNRRCRDCGRTFRSSTFLSGGFLLFLLVLLAIAGSVYYFKPKEPAELEPLLQMPADSMAIEWESHRLINLEREKEGHPPLQWDSRLAEIARAHSRDMAENDFFDHDNLEGQDPTDRGMLADFPCRKASSYGIGENILQGNRQTGLATRVKAWWNNQSADDLAQIEEAKESVSVWMDSLGHKENILYTGYDSGGIGAAYDGGIFFLTQNFC